MDPPTDSVLSGYKYLFDRDLLKDHVAFVTGGGSGIGFTICEILMRHGCDTVIASRRLDKLQESAGKLEKATGRRCLAVQIDVRKPETITRGVDQALERFGKIHILVNNAAGNFLAPITALSHNAFRNVVDIDLFGTFNCSKIIYEKCFRDCGGVVVNISATLPYRGDVLQSHAGASKAGIDALTRHMAVEWGHDNVRVVGVAPGPIANTIGMSKLGGQLLKSNEGQITSGIPLERWGDKAEIGHAVLFLASRAGSYVTGETLVVDGGAWLTTSSGAMMKQAMQSKM